MNEQNTALPTGVKLTGDGQGEAAHVLYRVNSLLDFAIAATMHGKLQDGVTIENLYDLLGLAQELLKEPLAFLDYAQMASEPKGGRHAD